MPIHDWAQVDQSVFHHVHVMWTFAIADELNRGRLPRDHYALLAATSTEADVYAADSNAVVIHHTSDHRRVALIEIVEPRHKSSRRRLEAFVSKLENFLRAGVHLLLVDLFPAGPIDPNGVHKAIWDRLCGDDNDFVLPSDRRLTLAAYVANSVFQAYIEPTKFCASLCDMPLFLSPETYVSMPLEATYAAAFELVPGFWREVLNSPKGPL
ncbi:MAG TPA: hypothetical protein VJ783_25820 [Pirellulales bacterium]|nr:hypothetical protein [Pirellulales bacterium]